MESQQPNNDQDQSTQLVLEPVCHLWSLIFGDMRGMVGAAKEMDYC